MAWIYLFVAGLLEVVWAVGLKYTEGLTRPLPSVLTGAAMLASFWFLSLAVRELPIGTAYAVWVGIGATGAVILGALLFGEAITLARGIFLVMLVGSIVGLRLTTPAEGVGQSAGERAP